ncbi:MAG: hypothetical protein JWQ89_4251 [Devosia sp.]|uniref:hypothetical protein n=1 Tax=Devosia sp. TaxID=1871048 RepID=UPI0026082118|nr:hypothetical protein [Devosia sp.]MDB5542524.1 hypothetical protein [Devosia sp.]
MTPEEDPDPIVETAVVREAAGILHTKEALEKAIDALLGAGFQRADIDIMGDIESVRSRLGTVFVPIEELPDIPGVPRRALITRDDQEMTTIGAFQTLFSVGAFATAMTVVATGGGFALALVAAAATGALTGTLGASAARIIGNRQAREIEADLKAGGIVLWVRTRGPEQEAHAQEILRSCGADGVRVHDIEIDKRLADVPLSDFQPDPLLEREHPPIH